MADRDFIDDWFGERKAPEPAEGHGRMAEPSATDDHKTAVPVAPSTAEPAMPALMTILDHALAMAARGFRCFPLRDGSKRPRVTSWPEQATTDPAKIRSWFETWPNGNYGVAAGEGVLILDVDAGKNGYATLLDLDLPPTLTVKTPGGGEHQYFSGPDVANSVDRIGDGLDTRSNRGYVVGPGSYFADNEPGKKKGYTGVYTVAQDMPPAVAPESLVLLAGMPPERAPRKPPACEPDLPENVDWAIPNYLTREPEDGGAPIAVEGQGGNQTTYQVFARLRELGISAEKSVELAEKHWNGRCLPPWSRSELVALAANADAYGQNTFGERAPTVVAEGFGDVVTIEPGPAEGSAEWQAVVDAAEQRDRVERLERLRGSLVRAEPGFAHHKAVPCVVENLAWRGEVTIFWGPGSAGKSLFAEAMLPAYAAAGKALGKFRLPKPIKTLVLNTEDTESETLSRAAACAEANGIASETVRDGLLVMKRDLALEFSVADYGSFKSLRVNDRGIGDLAALAREMGISLIVLDPLSNLHGLDDNSVADMSVVLKAVRRLAREADAAVILLLHTNKAGLDSPGDPSAMGGSGKLTTGVRKTVSFFPARAGGKARDEHPNADGADATGRFPMNLDKLEARTWVRMDDAKSNRGFGATTWFRISGADLPVVNEFGEPVAVPVMTLAYDADAPRAVAPEIDKALEFEHLDDADYARFVGSFCRPDGTFSDEVMAAIGALGVGVWRRVQPPAMRNSGPKFHPDDLAENMVISGLGWDAADPDSALKARAMLRWLVEEHHAERKHTAPRSRDGMKLGVAVSIQIAVDGKGGMAAVVAAIRRGPATRADGSTPRGGLWLLDNGRSANSIHLAFAIGMGTVRGTRLSMDGKARGLTEKEADEVDGLVKLWLQQGRLIAQEVETAGTVHTRVSLPDDAP